MKREDRSIFGESEEERSQRLEELRSWLETQRKDDLK